MTESEAIKICNTIVFATSFSNPQGIPLNTTKEELTEAIRMSIQALEKQIPKKVDKTEITISKRKFATELKQLVHQKCVEINHYVSGCNSPFSYLQIADVQESLSDIENTLNIKIKE